MTIHKLPVREVPEIPEETAYFDARTWEKPRKPTYGMLYQEYKLVIGILVGCLVMGVIASYFQSRNFAQIKDDLSRYEFLATQTKENTELCKVLVEKNQGMVDEMNTIGERLLQNIKTGITPKTARVVENKEVQP